MSEYVNRGLAVTACEAIAAVPRRMVDVSAAALRALPEMADAQYDRLKEILENIEFDRDTVTPESARENLESKLEEIRQLVPGDSSLYAGQLRVLPLAALSGTPLGHFVRDEERERFMQLEGTRKAFEGLVGKASVRMQEKHFRFVMDAVHEVARQQGFNNLMYSQQEALQGFVSLADGQGRAVVAQMKGTEKGVILDLDLTGFQDDGCHEVMDGLLAGLRRKGVILRDGERRSRLTRQETTRTRSVSRKKNRTALRTGCGKKREDLKRRQRNLGPNRLKRRHRTDGIL